MKKYYAPCYGVFMSLEKVTDENGEYWVVQYAFACDSPLVGSEKLFDTKEEALEFITSYAEVEPDFEDEDDVAYLIKEGMI